MKRFAQAIFLATVVAAVIGCGDSTSMTAEEQKAFTGGDRSGARSPEAQQGIADFAERYRQNNPSAGGPPSDRVPAGTPGGSSSS